MARVYLCAAAEPGLVLLRRQVHVVVGERSPARGAPQSPVLRAAQQRQRVAPHLAVRRVRLRAAAAAAQPRAQMCERHLLDERRAVLAEVPPLEDQNQPRDQRRRARQSHVELGRQRAQECRRVPHSENRD